MSAFENIILNHFDNLNLNKFVIERIMGVSSELPCILLLIQSSVFDKK